ncbi:MAG: hypothetical protein Q7S74_06615 [Nanoarchaeota archaeon]|nr:hypothetical protein [Nanoarchaeota archaeon]
MVHSGSYDSHYDRRGDAYSKLQIGIVRGQIELEQMQFSRFEFEFEPRGNEIELREEGRDYIDNEELKAGILKLRGQIKPRKERLQDLLIEFNSPVIGEDSKNLPGCPECGIKLRLNDKLNSGGSCIYYTPLEYCNNCSYYDIGKEEWTSDY